MAALAQLGSAMALILLTGAAMAQGVEPIEIDNTGPRATKLVILLVVFLFILFSLRRVRLPDMVRSAAIWLAVLVGLVTLYTYREPIESAGREVATALMPGVALSNGEQVIVRRARQGQFVLNGQVDGAAVDFLFDTGASLVVLSAADAARAGFDPAALSYTIPVMTAGGITEVAPVTIGEVTVGDIRMRSVRAAVARPQDLDTSLLGMTFLNRLSGYEVRRDRLVLNP
ncbi:MAG: TIGR02281 family clan AA aspartic protease [Pseudomonadota bacterium]